MSSAWKSEKTTPAQIALGFALGAFIGIVPSFAVGSFVAFYVAAKFGWNPVAAVSGTFLMNPLTAPGFYAISYVVGSNIAGAQLAASNVDVVESLQQFGWAYLAGIILVALTTSVATGCIVFAVTHYRTVSRSTARDYLPRPTS